MTASCSLLEELAHINSLGFMECVPLAVTRLSRVCTHTHARTHSNVLFFIAELIGVCLILLVIFVVATTDVCWLEEHCSGT